MPPKSAESTSRRQGLPLTSREVADSNNHLSKVFGGKQKPWMSHAGADTNNSTVASNRNLLAFSNKDAPPRDPPLTVITSDVRPSVKGGRGRPRKFPSSTSRQSGPPQTALPKHPPGPVDVPLPSPALTNEPSPAHSNRHVTPQDDAPANAGGVNPKSLSTGLGQAEQHPSPRDESATVGNMTNQAALSRASSQQAANSLNAALFPAASETQTSKRGRDPNSDDSVEDAVAAHTLKRVRLTGLTECQISSTESCKRLMRTLREDLEKHIDRAGGISVFISLEQHRYRCLLEACTRLDGFFLVIHQLFCAWSERTERVNHLLAPVTTAKVNQAFGIMQRLLLSNKNLEQKHRTHFANWPQNLEGPNQQMSIGDLCPTHLPQIREFVENLADKWESVMAVVQSRGYPLLANELMYGFRCGSVVMRKILFTVSRRLLGIKDRTSTRLNSSWDQDQAFELENLKGGILKTDLEKHRDSLRQLYKTMTVEARQRAQLPDTGSGSGSLTPVSALDPPPSSSLANETSIQTDPLTSLAGQYQVTRTTAVTSQPDATSRAAIVVPSSTVTASASEREETVAEDPGVLRPVQARPSLAHDSVQPPILQQTNSSRTSSASVSYATNSPAAQAQPQISTQASYARPRPALPAAMETSYNLDSPRAIVNPDLPSTSPELVLPSQRLQSQACQSQSQHVHHAVRYIPPHEAGMQQRGSAIPHATNSATLPQYPAHPHLIQGPSASLADHRLSLQSSTQLPRTHGNRVVSEGHRRAHQQFHPIAQMPYITPNQQSQQNSPSFHPNESLPVRQGITPTPHHFVHPQNASVSARGRPPYPVQNPVQPSPVPTFIPRAIPDNEAPTSPHDWVSAHLAAHLPRLRSPLRKPMFSATGRHYQYVETFRVQPWKVDPGYGVRPTTFVLSREAIALHYKTTLDLSSFEVHPYADGARRLRLRCCILPDTSPEQARAKWVETPTQWPSELYISFNGYNLNMPRKHHFKHDLPLELTDLLVEGGNELRLVLPKRNVLARRGFWFAIESVVVCSHDTLLKAIDPVKRPINISQMETMIAKRLSSGLDEEVQITSDSGLKISITDPYTSVMFDMPVRGVSCQHLECFDLTTYLETRRGKPTSHTPNQEPSVVDCWKCPICDRDARPCSLGVDLYMLKVRDELVRQGTRNCKAIIAQADGSWSAVEEPDDDEEDDEEPPSGCRLPSRPSASRPREVIEILDD